MPDGLQLDVGHERYKAGEALFRPELGVCDTSLSDLVYDTIGKVGMRTPGAEMVCNNIVLSGGLSLLAGLDTRLVYDLRAQATEDRVNHDMRVLCKPEAKYMEWIGASITATLTSFASNWITEQDYEAMGPSVVERKGMFTDLRRDAAAEANDPHFMPPIKAKPVELNEVEPAPVRVATAENMMLWRAAIEGEAVKVRETLENDKVDIDAGDLNNEGMSALHFASKYGNEDVVEILLAAGANCGNCDDFGKTPLHLASQEGRSAPVVAHLIAGGAIVNATDRSGRTPMHYAARGAHNEVVELLLLAGADSEAHDKAFRTPVDWAVSDGVKVTLAANKSISQDSSITAV